VMGRADLIGNGPHCLVPRQQPVALAKAGQGAAAPGRTSRAGRKDPTAEGRCKRSGRPLRK
jgi:hypothetical protein